MYDSACRLIIEVPNVVHSEHQGFTIDVEVLPNPRTSQCYAVFTITRPDEKHILFAGATAAGLTFDVAEQEAYKAARRWIEEHRVNG